MAVYRVTIPVTFAIEIDESNENFAPAPLLNGDEPITATRRAMWWLFHQHDRNLRTSLGVKRLFVKGKWEDFESVRIKKAEYPYASLTEEEPTHLPE